MRTLSLIPFIIFFLAFTKMKGQNNALIVNGAFVTLNGGTSSAPVYLVVAQTNTLGITRSSGHIISESDYNFVKWNAGATNGMYVYPFGYANTDYLPFSFNKTSGNANVAVSTHGTGTLNTPLANGVTNMNPSGPSSDASNMAVDRYWRVQIENGVIAPVADLTFSYRGAENTIAGISCPSNTLVAQYWNGGPNWVAPALTPGSACATTGVGISQSNGVNVFTATSSQPFILVKSTNILPVELLNFSAQYHNKKVTVQWSTATEINNDYFSIERSTDEKNFNEIGIVKGAGNSSTQKNYEFIDESPLSFGRVPEDKVYYKLKQVDFDGEFEYYGPISVTLSLSEKWKLIFQNIIESDELLGTLLLPEEENFICDITDLQGRVIKREKINGLKGSNFLMFDLSNIEPSIYMLKIYNSQNQLQEKFVKCNR